MDIASLILELTRIEGLTWVVGGAGPVSENSAAGMQEPQFSDGWATVKADNWHFHLKLDSVAEAQIVEEEGEDGVPLGYYLRLAGTKDDTLFRCYFPNPYRDAEGRPAEFQPRRLQTFQEFRDRHAGEAHVSIIERRRPSGG